MERVKKSILKNSSSEKGITLMALIITIIVMLILAGVTIKLSIQGDLISSAEKVENSTMGKIEEGQAEIDKIIEEKNNATILDDAFAPQYTKVNYSDGSGLKNYRIYGNSIQNGTPSPTSPVEIQSVGEKTRNLLNLKDRTLGELSSGGATTEIRQFEFDKYYVGLTMNNYYYPTSVLDYEVDGDIIKVSAKYHGYGVGIPMKVNPNTSYAIKCDGEGTIMGIGFYTAEGEWLSYIQASSFITPANCGVATIILRPNPDNGLTTYYNIQFEEGTQATAYEPYGYKIPVKTRSKNLFNINNVISSSNVVNNNDGTLSVTRSSSSSGVCGSTPRTLKDYAPDLEVGKTYILSADSTGPLKYIYLSVSKQRWGFGETRTISEQDLESVVYWYADSLDTAFTALISNIQIEEGTQSTDYESYQEPVTTNIYLDEPLRKIGAYADFIDFENQRIVRNVGNVVLDTSLPYVFYNYNTDLDNTYHYYINASNKVEPQIIKETEMLCNRFVGGNITMNRNESDSFLTSRYGTRVYGQIQKSLIDQYDGATEKDRLIQFFNEHYTELDYVLITPKIQYINLPKINTLEGNNTITIQTKIEPSDVILEF